MTDLVRCCDCGEEVPEHKALPEEADQWQCYICYYRQQVDELVVKVKQLDIELNNAVEYLNRRIDRHVSAD